MQFIEALKLRSKLLFLFLFVTLGLITIGIVGAFHIDATKKNLDAMYFGSFVPVTELNEILQLYHSQIAGTLYQAKSEQISPSQAVIQVDDALKKIEKTWALYDAHYKKQEEIPYIEYSTLEMQSVNSYFKKVIKAYGQNADASLLVLQTIENNISHIHLVLQKLINYEGDMAQYERKKFLSDYNKTLLNLGIILALVIMVVIATMMYVFKSIQKDQTQLEIATKKLKSVNKKLENASYTDTLTHLYNRRYFNMVYDRELKRAKRTHSYMTFMMLDVDFFKQYNDTYGHLEGDAALRAVAKALQDVLKRPSDFIFRLGGEEFGVLLTQTDEKDSARLAEAICKRVHEKEIRHETSKASEFLSISIGLVCCVADDALDGNLLMSKADAMLYEAKEQGRNRYVITTDVSDASIKTLDDAQSA
jgi:diguanylate cyclase (GGDEF)-like protein